MENEKNNSIKELDIVRREIIKSSFKDLSTIIDLIRKAYTISQNAPLREIVKSDGTLFTNSDERHMLLSILEREINELQYINEKNYSYYRFQITTTIVMLMVSISDSGISELEKVINKI